ncbi:hypothetical protein BY458DRAFT_502756 [Sporodiniella umbellata]|nr:hypothetical protein BY458DRAFT_502756 [Sporodiniella umbellata]
MPCKTIQKYVISDKQFFEWSIFVKENPWLNDVDNTSKMPVNVVSEYYMVDKESRTIVDKAYIATWSAEYQNDFRDLNLTWIKAFTGKLEPMDYKQLDNAKESIIDHGGEIYLLVNKECEVVGTTAMVIHDGKCELAKMSVKDGNQGKGYSHLLMRAAMGWAVENNHPTVDIFGSTLLESSIHLYKKYGFKTVTLGPHPSYERVNIHMRWYSE